MVALESHGVPKCRLGIRQCLPYSKYTGLGGDESIKWRENTPNGGTGGGMEDQTGSARTEKGEDRDREHGCTSAACHKVIPENALGSSSSRWRPIDRSCPIGNKNAFHSIWRAAIRAEKRPLTHEDFIPAKVGGLSLVSGNLRNKIFFPIRVIAIWQVYIITCRQIFFILNANEKSLKCSVNKEEVFSDENYHYGYFSVLTR